MKSKMLKAYPNYASAKNVFFLRIAILILGK